MKTKLSFLSTKTGIQDIKRWTRESLKERPFSTAKCKIWTETPSSIPLEEIYTKPRVVQKQRTVCNVTTEELKDVSEILGKSSVDCDGPVKVLTTGISFILV